MKQGQWHLAKGQAAHSPQDGRTEAPCDYQHEQEHMQIQWLVAVQCNAGCNELQIS